MGIEDPKTLIILNKFRLEFEKVFKEKCSMEKMLNDSKYIQSLISKSLDSDDEHLQLSALQILNSLKTSNEPEPKKKKEEKPPVIDDDDDFYLNGLR